MTLISILIIALLNSCSPLLKHEQEIKELGREIAIEEIDELTLEEPNP